MSSPPSPKRQKLDTAKEWAPLPASSMSARVNNPIRKIVDNIKKPEGKDIIPLSLGNYCLLPCSVIARFLIPILRYLSSIR